MASTLTERLDDLARKGSGPAVLAFWPEGGAQHIGYAELDRRARALAGGLAGQGVRAGDTVGLHAPNGISWIVARLGILFAGAVAVSLDTDLDAAALGAQLRASGARVLITTAGLEATVAEADLGDLSVWLLDAAPASPRALARLEDDAAPRTTLPHPDPDATASLFFTSGTTGPPKGVPLTHRNIVSTVDALASLDLVGPGDRVLLPLPLHHSYPFIVGLLIPLVLGATVVLPAGVSAPEIRQGLGEGRVRVVVGVPRLYTALAEGLRGRLRRGGAGERLFYLLLVLSTAARARFGLDLGRVLLRPLRRRLAPALETLASGGARLDPAAARTLEGLGWQVLSGYGLVETTSVATFNPPGRNRVGSAGLPAPGTRIALDRTVLDEGGDTGADDGEVLIRGPGVFPGYLDRPEANAAAFTAEGWFRSGDLGRVDADGYLWITGRVKEMIILPDGKNIAPEEIEAVYTRSPYIAEIAVLERDGALVGLVVPEIEALRAAGGAPADLIRVALAELAPQLPAYKRLSDWAITRETLPRTHLGKYQRHKLPEILDRAQRGRGAAIAAGAGADPADAMLLADPTVRAVRDWLQDRFPEASITPDSSPQLDLGIDSLRWVELGFEIQDRFGIALSETALARAYLVRDLLREVAAAANQPETAAGAGPSPARRGDPEALPPWLRRAPAWPRRAGTAALHGLVKLVARAVFGLRVTGQGHLPEHGPAILAPNHASDLDPLILAAALPGRLRHHVAWGADARRLFGNPAGRALARLANLFPVDEQAPGASLDAAVAALRAGRVLIWFPEEYRSPDGRLQAFKPGIGRILADTGAPVVPCTLAGTFRAMPRGARWPKPARCRVRFAAPIPFDRLAAEGTATPPPAIAAALRAEVARLAEAEGEADTQSRDSKA